MPPSPSPSSSTRPTSPSSTPSSPPSPPPDPLSSPSLPTLPSPPAWSTFVNSPPRLSAHSPSSAPMSSAGPDPIPTPRPPSSPTSSLAEPIASPSPTLSSTPPAPLPSPLSTNYLWPRMPRREDGDGPAALTVLSEFPSSPVFPFDHLPGIWRDSGPASQTASSCGRASLPMPPTAWGAAINTFDALEVPFLAHLRRIYHCVCAVRPMSPAGLVAERGGRSSIPAGELAAWLDACPSRSVVYVYFESQFTSTEK